MNKLMQLSSSLLAAAAFWALPSVSQAVPVAAVSFTSTPENFTSGLNSTRGWEFTVLAPIDVTALGLWDAEADGFSGDHQVGIFGSGGLITSLTVPSGTAASLGADNFRYVNLSALVFLDVGTYRIGALFADGDPDLLARNSGPVGAAGFLSYNGPRLSPSASFSDPTTVSANTNGIFSGNFLFQPASVSVPEGGSSLALTCFGGVLLALFARRSARKQ